MVALTTQSKTKRVTGLLFIFATAVIWIATSFISESLVNAHGGERAIVPPFLLTYLATTLFTLYLPLIHLTAWIKECFPGGKAKDVRSPEALRLTKQAKEGEIMAKTAAAYATPLWFLAQFTFNMSLAYTSVTSNTILSSTSSLFTFGFSIMMLGEHYTWKKLACIICCMAGTAMVTLADAEGSTDNKPIWGDALVLVSAAFYACYTVMMRKKMPGEEAEAHVAEFFGYVGLYTTVAAAPLVVFLISMGHISLYAIPKRAYLIILLEGLLDYVLSDYLWARGVMLLGPTVATLCLSVQIPIAAGAELIVGSPRWAANTHSVLMAVTGTLFILIGFFGINIPTPTSPPASPQNSLPGYAAEDETKALLRDSGESHVLFARQRRKSKGSCSGDELESGLLAEVAHGERPPVLEAVECIPDQRERNS